MLVVGGEREGEEKKRERVETNGPAGRNGPRRYLDIHWNLRLLLRGLKIKGTKMKLGMIR